MADEMHHMRIAAKRLRYTLEFCRPTLGNRAKTFLASARAVQDVLGDLHELDVWLDFLPKVMEEHKSKDIRNAAERLQQRCRRLRAQTHSQFVGLWKRIEREKVWEQLRKQI
jgi:CHAD domain-containing protein